MACYEFYAFYEYIIYVHARSSLPAAFDLSFDNLCLQFTRYYYFYIDIPHGELKMQICKYMKLGVPSLEQKMPKEISTVLHRAYNVLNLYCVVLAYCRLKVPRETLSESNIHRCFCVPFQCNFQQGLYMNGMPNMFPILHICALTEIRNI